MRGPVDPVVVVHVAENGQRLAQHNAGPHYHVAHLTSEPGECSQDAQGELWDTHVIT